MNRTVTVGLDGSLESRSAAVGVPPTPFRQWGRAAREAQLLGVPLKPVHVWEPVPDPIAQAPLLGAETQRHRTERVPREAAVTHAALHHSSAPVAVVPHH